MSSTGSLLFLLLLSLLLFSGSDAKRKARQPQWIGYDSNVAEVDGSLHVFSDAAVSDEEQGRGAINCLQPILSFAYY